MGFPLGIKSAIKVGVSFMVCEELDQLEWDFIQARGGKPGHRFFGMDKS